jgi:transposase
MSSTLRYRAFGFRQYRCTRTTATDGVLTLHLVQDPKHDRCSYCQSPDVIRHGAEERTVRTVPVGGRRCGNE